MKNYFKTYFLFDLIATCFGAAAFFKTQDMLIVAYFKLARLVRLRDIGSSIYFIVRNSCCREITTQRGIVYKRLIKLGIQFLLAVHIITCFWIWLGCLDAGEDDPQSWIFQNDSYFTGEENLTIYEQVTDPDNTKIYPLYIYSVLYILTVLTTVGYGNHSY